MGGLKLKRRRPRGLLFLCVANSARSQMAEGIARSLAPRGVGVNSAGSAPAAVNPLAVQVMREIGIDISRQASKPVSEVKLGAIGTVVTLCAEEVCPIFPGPVQRVHWPLPDPAAARGSLRDRLKAFRRVRTELRYRIGALMELL